MTKATFIVTDMDIVPHYDEAGDLVMEYVAEKAALKAAADKLANSDQSEVWVWKLSHVVSKPEVEPDIEFIK